MDQSTDAIPCLLRQAGDNYEMKYDEHGKPIGWVLKPGVVAERKRQQRVATLKFIGGLVFYGTLAGLIGWGLQKYFGWNPCEFFTTCL